MTWPFDGFMKLPCEIFTGAQRRKHQEFDKTPKEKLSTQKVRI